MAIKYTRKQRERLQTSKNVYYKRTKGKDGRYYLSISDEIGQIKRVLWKPSKGTTVKAAKKRARSIQQEAAEARERRKVATNDLYSVTWEEIGNPDKDSRAYMEIRLVLPAGTEFDPTVQNVIEYARRNLTAKERQKLTTWADVFEIHGVEPTINVGSSTESPSINVELDVHEGLNQREEENLRRLL